MGLPRLRPTVYLHLCLCVYVNMLSSNVSFNAARKSIARNGRAVSGLTKLLKARFYPNWSYAKAGTQNTEKHTIKGGKRVGNGTDQAISQSVTLAIQHHLRPAVFFQKAALLEAAKRLPLKPRMHLRRLFTRRLPYLRWFWQSMERCDYTPVATQVPVAHRCLDVGTLVDVVCKNGQQQYVILEVKTGFDNYYTSSNATMKAPFETMPNCPQNQHHLQLAATRAMFQMTFPTLPIAGASLMRFHSGGVSKICLANWAEEKTGPLFTALEGVLRKKK